MRFSDVYRSFVFPVLGMALAVNISCNYKSAQITPHPLSPTQKQQNQQLEKPRSQAILERVGPEYMEFEEVRMRLYEDAQKPGRNPNYFRLLDEYDKTEELITPEMTEAVIDHIRFLIKNGRYTLHFFEQCDELEERISALKVRAARLETSTDY